jgi:hypothetical protein
MGHKHDFFGLMAIRFLWSEVVCGKDGEMKMIIVVPLPIRHKLNYFLFCQSFEKLFIICA